jgi:hypothetical protein
MVVSWPVRTGFLGRAEPLAIPESDAERIALISVARCVAPDASVKALELYDWPPPEGLRTQGHVALVGDAVHPMTMCTYFLPWLPYLPDMFEMKGYV